MAVFGSLKQLADTLRAQATENHGQIVLSQATMWGSDPRVPNLLQAELGRRDLKLVVDPAAIPTDPGATLPFPVATPSTATDTFLGLVGLTGLTITFDLADESAVNFTLLVDLPADWTLATSWRQLVADPVANHLPFKGATLTIDTHTGTTPVGFHGPIDTGGPGLGLDLIAPLLGMTSLPPISVEGAINPGPAFDLRLYLLDSAPPPLGGLVQIGKPYFGVRSLQIPYPDDPDGKTYVASQWLVGADLTLGGTAELTLAAIAQPGLPGFALAVLPATPAGTSIESLIDGFLHGTGLSQGSFTDLFGTVPFVQDVLSNVLNFFAFKGFFAAIAVGRGGGIRYLALNIGSTLGNDNKPKYQLPIIPKVLTADSFDLQWMLFDPASPNRTMSLTIDAVLTIAEKFPFALQVAFPNFSISGRYTGAPIQLGLKELEQQLFKGEVAIPLGFEVTFTGLQFEATPPNVYTLSIQAGADIELFGTRLLSITDGNLTVTRTYPADSTTATNALAFAGVIGLGPLNFAVTAQVGNGDTIFTIHTVGQTLGGLLTQLVRLIDPYLDLRLESPWDFLNTIDLDKLVLTVNVTQGKITLAYPINLSLGFVTINSIGLEYQRAKADGSAPSSLQIEVTCTFLGVKYGSGGGQPPLGWNPVTDRAPAVPGSGAALFDLQYVALGQHVTVDGDLTTIANIFKALRGTAVPLTPGASDPSKLPGVTFDENSQWLIAAQFTVMGAVSLSGVFNDPKLAGLRIALAGEKVKAFAGLEFEILYTRVTPTIGLYHVELKLPDAMRHLEFGEVSVTLPVVVVDIYTNGNFRIDFGFPKGLDFSRSFSIQAFPFVGYGGFYFALLDGQTSKRVPQITNGQFKPVIEFGLALSLGVGKTIDEGVFSAGATVTLVGIVEGVIGWFEPSSNDVAKDQYYWIQGTVALTGQVFGKVDFAIISVDVRISAQASITVTIEAYQPIHVALVAKVSVQASIKILFIRIHFSFSLTLNLAFTIGSASTPPWHVAAKSGGGQEQAPALAAEDASRPTARPVHLAIHGSRREHLGLALEPAAALRSLEFGPRSVAHLIKGAAPTIQALDLVLVPAFTKGDDGGPVQCVLLPFIENSIPPQAHAVAETTTVSTVGTDASFNQLAVRLFAWVVGALGDHVDSPDSVVTADDLRRVAAALYDPRVEDGPLSYANLRAFVDANFVLRVFARTPNANAQLSATVFPMLPDLALTTAGTTIDFATQTPVGPAYQQAIDAYLQQLAVAYENDVEARAGGGGAQARATARLQSAGSGSMAGRVFGNWATMLARAVVDAAVAIARAYSFVVPATGASSLGDVAASFPPATGVLVCAVGDTLDSVAARCGTTVAAIRALNPNLSPQFPEDAQLPIGDRLTVPVVVTPASIIAANPSVTGVLTPTPLPLTGVQYQVRAGDTVASIAAAFHAIAQLDITADALTTQLLTGNAGAAVLQPGVIVPVPGVAAYACQTGDTPAIVAATYLVRSGGSVVLNQLPDLPSAVQALEAANPSWTANQLIPDGTTITIPASVAAGGSRTARLGDTLTRLAATLLAPSTPAVDLGSMLAAFVATNTTMPRDPDAPLTAGTALVVPPITASVDPGETLDDIAVAFGAPSGASVGSGVKATAGLLSVGAILQLGPLHWKPLATDSFGSIMGQLNLTVEDLAADIASVEGSLQSNATLTVPQVPALTLAQLQEQLLVGGQLNTAAATISRFLLHGLRLPTPTSTGATDAAALTAAATAGVYGLIGQQFAVVAGNDVTLAPGSGAGPAGGLSLYMGGYTTKPGDTLAGLAQRFALAGQQSLFQSTLQVLNPGVNWSNLAAGTQLCFPGASAYVTVAGDDVNAIVKRFCNANELTFVGELRYLNPTVDFGVPLPTGTQVILPIADTTTTVLGDTPETVARRFVAAADADGLAEFVSVLVQQNPPIQPNVVIPPDTVLTLPPTSPDLPVQLIDLQWSSDEQAVIAALQKQTFDAASTATRLPLYRVIPERWGLSQVLHWQAAVMPTGSRFSEGPAAGEPTIWPFPSALQQVVATSTPDLALQLVTARSDSPADAATTEPVANYAWATAISFGIRQVDGADAPRPNTYQITGADQTGRDQLELLWRYLGATAGAVTATLLYSPSPTSGNPAGLVSDALNGTATFVVQANLSTVSTSGATMVAADAADGDPTPPPLVHSAELTDTATLCQLLWECSVVHGGGYYLEYTTAAGAGLPEQLFRQGPEASLTLLVLVDEGVDPPAPPSTKPAHNCAVVTSNIPAGSTQVYVQPVLHEVGATDTLDDIVAAIATNHGVETTTDALLAANPRNLRAGADAAGAVAASMAVFRPGTAVLAAPAPTQLVADAPAGTTGFELTRPDPGADTDTSGVDSLFQLLAFAVAEGGGFRASPQGLPAGPAGNDATDVGNGTWDYRALLPVARFADDGLPAPTDVTTSILPLPWLDPYRGIAPRAAITVDLEFRDVYGNGAGGSGTSSLTIPVGYFDNLIALSAWPSVAADFAVAPAKQGAQGTVPSLELDLGFDPTRYLAGPGLSATAAADAAAVHRVRFGQIYYQLRQAGVTAVLRSSLDQTASGQIAHPVAVGELRAFALSVHAFLRAAESLIAYQYPVVDTDTIAALASRFAVSVADLAKANADVDASTLFSQPTLSIPVFATFAHGGTLTALGITAEQLLAGSIDVPLAPGVDLSLASQPGTHHLTGTPTPSLRQIAEATKAATGSIATANAQHPLTEGLTLLASGATLTTGSGGSADTLATMVQRFGALTPPVVITAGDLGTANQDVAGLFDGATESTLTITDRLVARTETLRSITAGPGAPSATGLAADNLGTVDLYPPGAAIWRSNQAYTLQAGDTLGSVASRFAVDLATLVGLRANAEAALTAKEGARLTVPSQVTLAPDRPLPAAARVLGRPPTADEVNQNRFTADLFVAGALTVAGIALTVSPADLPDTLCTQAQAMGYPGSWGDFAPAAATALAAQPAVLDPYGTWIVAPITVGATRTLVATAEAAGVSVEVLIRSNGSLRGLLRPGASVSYPTTNPITIELTLDDTLLTLAARFTAAGVPLTLPDLAQHAEITGADMLVEHSVVVPPAMVMQASIPFTATPQNPELIFPVTVALELARPTDRVDPDFAGVTSVVLATSTIAPRATPGDDGAHTLQGFATDFEAAFPGLKAAVSQRQQGVAEAPDPGTLWAVDMRATGLGYQVEAGPTHASYFALPPLSTDLLSYSEVPIQPYASGTGLGAAANRAFRSIDLDAWLGQFLAAIDSFLAAASAPAARFIDPASLDQVIADKQRIAGRLAGLVLPVYSDGPAGDLAQAQEALEQAMLISLSAGYQVSTIVQLPVTVRAPAGVDPNLAPRLSGAPVANDGSGAGESSPPPSPYSLSTAKVPLALGTQPLTFTVSVKQPAADRVLALDLRYAVTEIEHGITNVTGIADYQRSSWLTLLRPASLEPDGEIGELQVPVPLRAAPAPPTMVSQTATASVASTSIDEASLLDQLKRWDYAFEFNHPTADQDVRHLTVTFNAPSSAAASSAGALAGVDLVAVFNALAQFVSVYPALQADLGLLPRLRAGTSNPIAATAVEVFADLVHRVASAMAPPALADVLAADLPGIVLEYTVTVDADARTMTLALPANQPPPAIVGWPVIVVTDLTMTGEDVGPTATSRTYQFPNGVPPSSSTYQWRFRRLDVTLVQSGVSAMWVVRNQNLGGTVNAAFVYQTAVVEFTGPIVPLLVSQTAVPIGGSGQSITQALVGAFIDLFGSGPWSADVKLGARYGYSFGGDASMIAMLPVFLISRLTIDANRVPTLAAEAERIIGHFTSTWDPNPHNGHYLFEVTVYAAQSGNTGLAVLDLQNLEYALAAQAPAPAPA